MKQTLLLLSLWLFVGVGLSAQAFDLLDPSGSEVVEKTAAVDMISIFPNPAYDFIAVNNDDDVATLIIFNMVGRQVKRFTAQKGEKYQIGNLQSGFYLVQLLDRSNAILTTQRIHKK